MGAAREASWGQGGLFQGPSWAVDSVLGSLGVGSGSELQALDWGLGPTAGPWGFWALL